MSIENSVRLVGNLGRDPEVKTLPNGKTVVNFSMATNEKYKDADGNPQSQTEWHNIVAFGKLADICGKYLTKGKQIIIEGKLQTRKWEDRDGNNRYTTEIIANQMKMLGGDGGNPANTRPVQNNPAPDVDDTDAPF